MKYLISAILLLVVTATAFSLLSSVSETVFVVEQKEELFFCGTEDPPPTRNNFPQGKTLYQQNCQTCHSLDKVSTGPALRGFTERGPWGDKKNVVAWIRNPEAFMKNDPYTQALKKEYGVVMQSFPHMTEDDINQIIQYISQ